MNIPDYERYMAMSDRELIGFLPENEGSERKHAAHHILELRRAERAAKASEQAAVAARWSAIAAFLSVLVAVAALFLKPS